MENIEEYRIRIVTGQYHRASSEQKKMIQDLFGADAEDRYEIYFHWYNVLHELGHAIMMFNAPSRPHPAEEEQLVNDFAYAYWKHYGEREKREKLRSIVNETIHRFIVPARNGENYLDYAKNMWNSEELFEFNNYGWFQFSCVQAAITKAADLEQALSRMCSIRLSPQKPEVLSYKMDDEMPSKVVSDAVRLIKEWGILLPEEVEIAFCDDVNCHMCQVENLRDGSVY